MPPQGDAAAAARADKSKPPPPASTKGLAALLGHGDEGEECDVPACRTMVDVLKRATGAAAAQQRKGQEARGAVVQVQDEDENAEAPVGSAAWRKQSCPLGKEALGETTWGFLHSIAAYYPEKPTDSEQGLARSLMQSIAAFYPCGYCRKDFQKSIASDPPRVDSRPAFAVWLCHQHNLVNEKLGKPLFACDIANLDRRWRTGDPRCWEEDVPADPSDGGAAQAAAKTAPPAAPAAGAAAGGKEKAPKIYIIEPKDKKKG